MRKGFFILLCAVLFGVFPTLALGIDFDLNLHLGSREAEPIIVSEPPLFLQSATLGVQVAVGNPVDLFCLDGRYFLFRDQGWLVASSYGGPWTTVRRDRLPPGLARHSWREIVALRDVEYENYRKGRYRGKTFRPDKVEHGKGKGHGKGKHK